MLTDWHRDSKVAIGKVWTNNFVRHNNVKTNNCVLRIFCALKEHAYVNVLDIVKLFLSGNNIFFLIFFFFFQRRSSLRLSTLLLSSCSLWVWFGFRVRLCLWINFLRRCFVLKLSCWPRRLIFITIISKTLFGGDAQFFKLNFQIGGI